MYFLNDFFFQQYFLFNSVFFCSYTLYLGVFNYVYFYCFHRPKSKEECSLLLSFIKAGKSKLLFFNQHKTVIILLIKKLNCNIIFIKNKQLLNFKRVREPKCNNFFSKNFVEFSFSIHFHFKLFFYRYILFNFFS